jgi:hypothetical protein
MKTNLFFILIFCFPLLLFAQFDYDVSSPYKVVDGEKFYVGEEGKMLAVKRHRKEVHIQLFNSTKPALSSTKVYSDTELPKGFVIEKLLAFGDKYYLFFNVWDKPNLTEQLFYREINIDKGEFVGKNELILKIEGKITGSPLVRFNRRYSYSAGRMLGGIAINMNGSKKFGFSLSQNKSKLIIQYRKKPLERKDEKSKDIMGMFVYSHEMEKDAGSEIEMPYTEKEMDNLDYTVDAAGTPYILAKVFTSNTTRESKKNPDGNGKVANYQIELFKIDLKAKKILATPIKTEEKFITKIALYESVDNDLVCTGYYNTSGPTKTRGSGSFWGAVTPHTDGICMFKIKKSGGISDINYYEIPVEIMNQYERKGTQKRNERKDDKGKAQFEYLTLRESLIQDDGSIIVIGEQYHIKEGNTTTTVSPPTPGGFGGTRQAPPQHLYEDVLIAKINPNGELSWMRKLPKKQLSDKPEKGGMSIKYIQDKENGKHYLMYLDNVKNIDLDINKIPKNHIDGKGGFLTSFKIDDETGDVTKENLFDLRDVKGIGVRQFNTDRIVHTSDNEFVVEVYKKGKEDILIKIKVK